MDELFNILSSSARINKSKKKKKVAQPSSTVLISQPISHAASDMEDDGEGGRKSRDMTGKRDRTPAKLDQIHREDVAAFRNRLSIRLSAGNRHDLTLSDPITTFDELAQPAWWLHQPQLFSAVKNTLLKNIEMGKWTEPTPIQMQSIPTLLEKRDTLGCAPTGSGKSGAFIIPALFIGSAPQSVFYNTSVASKSDSGDGGKKKKKKNKHQEKHGDPDTEGGIRTLLLAPSRELAAQLHREVVRLGDGKIHGLKAVLLSKPNAGVVISGKAGGKRGLDVLVSTPLRLVECIRQGLDLSHVRLVVLDEADRLLDVADGGGTKHTNDEKNMDKINDLKDGSISEDSESSEEEVTPQNSKNQADPIQQQQSGSRQTQTFLAQIDAILSHIPTSAIRGLFSATITPPVRSLSESMLRNPVDITIGGGSSGPSANTDIDQKLMFVGREEGKLLAIRQITQKGIKPPVIIFLESKDRAQALFGELMYDGIRVDVIHAGRSQSARDEAVAKFRRGETWVLICTDLVARGVDFKAVNMVINYDLPTSGVTYVHRIGRTGRAGRKGEAITFFTESDFDNLRTIANVMKLSGCEVPAWMLSLKKSQTRGGSSTGHTNHKAKKKHTTDRRRIETTPAYDNVTKYKKKQNIEQSMKRKRSSNEATKSSTPVKSSSNMGKKKKAKNSK